MELLILDDYAALSRAAADAVQATIMDHPNAVVVMATGNSPMGAYAELAERQQRSELDARGLRLFQLDEYAGVGPADHRSLYGWTRRAFADPLGIPPEQIVRLAADSGDPAAACRAYEAAIEAAGGFDLALLGLGPNGHLGFNEPPAGPQAPTRLVSLAESSIDGSAAYWGSRADVPRQAITAGMDRLLAARRILLLVSGTAKHRILRQAVEGPLTPDVPASYLQLAAQATIIADAAAWHGD
jgi:glucosamine-6-phosphate deaminase